MKQDKSPKMFTGQVEDDEDRKEILQIVSQMESYINEMHPNANFCYPKEYFDSNPKVLSFNWEFPVGVSFLQWLLSFFKKAHDVTNLIPFAINNADGNDTPDEIACFIIDGRSNHRIRIVWPWGDYKCFYQEEYENLVDWLDNGFD